MGKKRTGASLSKDHYWCVQYLATVQNIDQSQLMSDALEIALQTIKNNSPRRPKKPEGVSKNNAQRIYYNVDKDLWVRATMLRIDKELYDWKTIDLVRYGLNILLRKYSNRYPEIDNIVRRFGEDTEN